MIIRFKRLFNPPAVVALAVFWFASAQISAEDLPIPDQWSTYYAWFLVANPDYSPGSEEEEGAITADHIQYQLRLQEDGLAIAAGGLGPGEGDSIIGLTILRAESLAEARKLAEADPAVEAGRLEARVREWWVPSGRLP